MTIPARMRIAADDHSAVIGIDGILAAFNDAGVLAPTDVLAAEKIGRLYGEDRPDVLLAAALTVRGTRYGHVCIRLDRHDEAVVVDAGHLDEARVLDWPDPATWAATVADSSLVGDGSNDTPLVLADDRLYLNRYNTYEEQVAAFILGRLGTGTPGFANAGPHLLSGAFPAGTPEAPNRQRAAATLALTSRFVVIAGGPGTGKTYTIAALLSALAHSPEPFPVVALAAPTGKAAARLGEAIVAVGKQTADETARTRLGTIEASTIHRLLGYSPARGRFRHDQDNRLPHDLIIIDEMSMVSLPLAARLFSAVRDDATVVLVGDPNQLESIEAGTVLADIVGPAATGGSPSGSHPIDQHVVVLDRGHRFAEGGAIAGFADAVRSGDADGAIEMLSDGDPNLAWIRGDAGLDALVDRVVAHRIELVDKSREPEDLDETLRHLGKLAVLAAHHHGPQSVDRWRYRIEDALRSHYGGLGDAGGWYPGQPVMITANDYALGLYNGDIGVTVTTADGPVVAFGGETVRTFPRSQIGDHTTVHAMTIHKSQGSQFTEVVVALPAESSRLLTRELLYTAVTRAAKKVTIIGDEAVIRHAVERSVERASGLSTRLRP